MENSKEKPNILKVEATKLKKIVKDYCKRIEEKARIELLNKILENAEKEAKNGNESLVINDILNNFTKTKNDKFYFIVNEDFNFLFNELKNKGFSVEIFQNKSGNIMIEVSL